jgi:hypothetical protein
MGKRKRKHNPQKPSTGAPGSMEQERHQAPAGKPKKRFWKDYDSTEKFNVFVGLFVVFSSVATGGLYQMTRKTLVVSQQAYVFAKNANVLSAPLKQPPHPFAPAQVQIVFRNSGQTVARQFRGTINFYSSKDGIPPDFLFPEDSPSRPSLIGPQSETNLTKVISDDMLTKVRGNEVLLFVYGSFTYKDIFGSEHRSEYCFQYLGVELDVAGEAVQYIFWNGPVHNCDEDDCKEDH